MIVTTIGDDIMDNNRAILQKATKNLITKLAEEKNVDYRTIEGFIQVLPELTQNTLREKLVDEKGKTLNGLLLNTYKGSATNVVLDLINKDEEFKNVKDIRAYDFKAIVPQNYWIDKEGNPTQNARYATKCLIERIAQEKGIDYRTMSGFEVILPELTQNTFYKTPINRWGTTLGGMLQAYEGSPLRAVLDVIDHDDEFKALRGNVKLPKGYKN